MPLQIFEFSLKMQIFNHTVSTDISPKRKKYQRWQRFFKSWPKFSAAATSLVSLGTRSWGCLILDVSNISSVYTLNWIMNHTYMYLVTNLDSIAGSVLVTNGHEWTPSADPDIGFIMNLGVPIWGYPGIPPQLWNTPCDGIKTSFLALWRLLYFCAERARPIWQLLHNYYTTTTLLLHCYYTTTTQLLHKYYTNTTLLLHYYYTTTTP